MTLGELIAQAVKVKDAILAGKFAEAGKLTLPIQEQIFDWLMSVGFQTTAESDAELKKLDAALKECSVACTATHGPAVGKLGDGVLLKILLDLLIKFLPLFIKDKPVE